jgi:ligand-binding sensor protein
MKLTDVQPLSKWLELEEAIHERTGMRASVYDTEGIGITGQSKQANALCEAIRDTGKGQTYICAVAHQNMAAIATQTRQPVIEECDAGLIKIVVPIFVGDEFVGAAGGCGLLMEGGKADEFMINKTTDLPESRITKLAETVAPMTMAEADELAQFIREMVEKLVGSSAIGHQ